MMRTLTRTLIAIISCLVPLDAMAQHAEVQQLRFTPFHADGRYEPGDTVGWYVTPGDVPPTYLYRWTIRRNNAVVLKEGKLDLTSGKTSIEILADQPAMIYVAIEPYADLKASGTPSPSTAPYQQTRAEVAASPATSTFTGGNTGRNNGLYALGAAVAPEKLGLSTPRPADFDAFWSEKLGAQAKLPIEPQLTTVATSVPDVREQMFALDALGSKVHGYLAQPTKEGTYPALIQLQYAGVYALNAQSAAYRASQGWLVVNVDAHDKAPSDPSGGISPNYQALGNTDRDKSYFLDMYLRDSRALDFLMSLPAWDGKTVVVTGGSMGGQQSLALAGLRPDKITAVLVCVPAGADTNGDLHGRKAGYPNWPSSDPAAMHTALYFDTVNFASRIQAPVMAGMGYIDTTSPPAGVWTALNQVRSAKEVLPIIDSEHDNLTWKKAAACTGRVNEILHEIVGGVVYRPAAKQP